MGAIVSVGSDGVLMPEDTLHSPQAAHFAKFRVAFLRVMLVIRSALPLS